MYLLAVNGLWHSHSGFQTPRILDKTLCRAFDPSHKYSKTVFYTLCHKLCSKQYIHIYALKYQQLNGPSIIIRSKQWKLSANNSSSDSYLNLHAVPHVTSSQLIMVHHDDLLMRSVNSHSSSLLSSPAQVVCYESFSWSWWSLCLDSIC